MVSFVAIILVTAIWLPTGTTEITGRLMPNMHECEVEAAGWEAHEASLFSPIPPPLRPRYRAHCLIEQPTQSKESSL